MSKQLDFQLFRLIKLKRSPEEWWAGQRSMDIHNCTCKLCIQWIRSTQNSTRLWSTNTPNTRKRMDIRQTHMCAKCWKDISSLKDDQTFKEGNKHLTNAVCFTRAVRRGGVRTDHPHHNLIGPALNSGCDPLDIFRSDLLWGSRRVEHVHCRFLQNHSFRARMMSSSRSELSELSAAGTREQHFREWVKVTKQKEESQHARNMERMDVMINSCWYYITCYLSGHKHPDILQVKSKDELEPFWIKSVLL